MALELRAWGGMHTITLEVEKYADNGRLAIQMWCEDDGFLEPWSSLTVNIPDRELTDENCAFIDTNNNGEEICHWLIENKLAEHTNRRVTSGFWSYPEFRFNMAEVAKHLVKEA